MLFVGNSPAAMLRAVVSMIVEGKVMLNGKVYQVCGLGMDIPLLAERMLADLLSVQLEKATVDHLI